MGLYTIILLLIAILCSGICIYWGSRASLFVAIIGVLLLVLTIASLYSDLMQRLYNDYLSVYVLFFVSGIMVLVGFIGIIVNKLIYLFSK